MVSFLCVELVDHVVIYVLVADSWSQVFAVSRSKGVFLTLDETYQREFVLPAQRNVSGQLA